MLCAGHWHDIGCCKCFGLLYAGIAIFSVGTHLEIELCILRQAKITKILLFIRTQVGAASCPVRFLPSNVSKDFRFLSNILNGQTSEFSFLPQIHPWSPIVAALPPTMICSIISRGSHWHSPGVSPRLFSEVFFTSAIMVSKYEHAAGRSFCLISSSAA